MPFSGLPAVIGIAVVLQLLLPPPLCQAATMPCNPQVTAVRSNSTLPVAMVNTILRLHNEARYNASPSAVTMPPVQWSEELAIGAQEYLDSCPGFKHSAQTTRRNRYGFVYIGENLAGGMRFDLGGYERACNMWIDERDAWEYGGATCSTGSVCGTCTTTPSITSCGHYTQVVWATTTHIGCGYAQCASDNMPIYNCWYGPGGNIQGKGPYAEGARDSTQTCPPTSTDASTTTTSAPTTTSATAPAGGTTTTTMMPPSTTSTSTQVPPGGTTTTAAPGPGSQTTTTTAPGGNPPPGAAPPNSDGDDDGPSEGVIAAATIGGLVAVAGILGLVVYIVRKPAAAGKTGASDVEEMMLADSKQPVMVAAPPSAAILTADDGPSGADKGNRERTMTYSQL